MKIFPWCDDRMLNNIKLCITYVRCSILLHWYNVASQHSQNFAICYYIINEAKIHTIHLSSLKSRFVPGTRNRILSGRISRIQLIGYPTGIGYLL